MIIYWTKDSAHFTPGLSNLNEPRAAHLSVRYLMGRMKKNKGSFIDFLKNFDYKTHHISNYTGLIGPKIVIQYFLVSLFH